MTVVTLEEAQERILELEGQVTELTNERDTLSNDNKTLADDLEKVRTLNQKYFGMLSQQEAKPDEPEDDEDEQTLEDFAKTLKMDI